MPHLFFRGDAQLGVPGLMLPAQGAENIRPLVLVVDDEPGVCWALDLFLTGKGFSVVTAQTAAEALGLIKSRKFHIALIDSRLPDMTGIELTQEIRAGPACSTKFILISGFFSDDDVTIRAHLSSGLFSAYIPKPIRHDRLLDTVKLALTR